MNYFAHGLLFLDTPYFLAGTAAPDWLSVSDRRVRLRARNVRSFSEGGDTPQSQFAAGVLRHLADDDWFHSSRAFHETTGQLAKMFKPLGDDGFRPGFLGHIAMELLLDAVLMRRHPGAIDRYYEVCQELDEEAIQEFVTVMTPRAPEQLAKFIRIFKEVQFLRCYTDPHRLLRRINQVLERVRLVPLPEAAVAILEQAYDVVEENADLLLPREHFR